METTDEALKDALANNLPLTTDQRAALFTLVVERAKLDANADRYHWMRSNTAAGRNSTGRQVFYLPMPSPAGHDLMRGSVAQHLDDCIDATMKTDAESVMPNYP